MGAIESAYVEAHEKSATLYARAAKVLPSGVTHDSRFMRPFPLYANRAAGSRKWDVDGHEYVDFVMGHGALLLGHNFPSVTEAARLLEAARPHGCSRAAIRRCRLLRYYQYRR